MAYTTTAEVAAQLKYRNDDDPRLARVVAAVTEAINHWCGITEDLEPVPPGVAEVALSLAVDMWKQPDASFGIVGLGETGTVRVARELVARYDAMLLPYYTAAGWGVA